MTDAHGIELDDLGRRRRGRILGGIGVTVIAVAVVGGTLLEQRDESQMRDLRVDVAASFGDLTGADLAPMFDSSLADPAGSEVSVLDFLTTEGGHAPDLVERGADDVRARYLVGSRCLRVVWTDDGPEYDEGEGRQCSSLTLD